ncbi:hypothetical protein AtubIFM55763_009447 [Aspergillus tubingensis]|uniref:Uncharacterized protein n=1 Tax=Aspergillus tubingensis TaxID=5068 RepID=A0A9W6EMJ2_ASPTU|nr:hypothetical protein AtubIFM54640_007578 [Aspergillus tubingensis]GLA69493.1 hypothetical protein AtubIFM55763_009447 [Aspergillus tubingensis]GLA84540.1 hypothetical protein AtubIFM56815_008755 [Aspergillus tubingensis]
MFDSFSELYADQLKLITDALDQAGINNVLWGHVIEQFLKKSVSWGIECIIHDGMAEKACQTLLAAGLEACKNGEDCPATRHWQDRLDAVAHVHFEAFTLGCDIAVVFWEKSSLLWAFPDLPSSPPSSDDPYYMPIRIPWTYYDSRSQRPPIDLTPARMIKPVKIVEALIWLMCRDRNPNEGLEWGWEHRWQEVLESWVQKAPGLAEHGLFCRNELRPEFLPLWDYLSGGEGEQTPKKHRAHYLGLQAKLRAENALPSSPQPKRRTIEEIEHQKWKEYQKFVKRYSGNTPWIEED